jgi:nucleotide-binding universal stress UspA family protein
MSQLPTRILVAVDYDEPSRHALTVAGEFADALGARLDVLYVWAVPFATPAISAPEQTVGHNLFGLVREQAADQLQHFIAPLKEKWGNLVVDWFVESGEPVQRIVDHAKERGCNWIALGTHGRGGPGRWLLGSVAEQVLRHAPCPVLIVPTGRE